MNNVLNFRESIEAKYRDTTKPVAIKEPKRFFCWNTPHTKVEFSNGVIGRNLKNPKNWNTPITASIAADKKIMKSISSLNLLLSLNWLRANQMKYIAKRWTACIKKEFLLSNGLKRMEEIDSRIKRRKAILTGGR